MHKPRGHFMKSGASSAKSYLPSLIWDSWSCELETPLKFTTRCITALQVESSPLCLAKTKRTSISSTWLSRKTSTVESNSKFPKKPCCWYWLFNLAQFITSRSACLPPIQCFSSVYSVTQTFFSKLVSRICVIAPWM